MSDTKKRLLIVEDDSRLAHLLTHLFSERNWNVKWCADLETAGNLLVESQFELVLLDFNLPDGNAVDFLSGLKEKVHLPRIIAVSAYANSRESFTLASLGVWAYLQKPITSEAVLKAAESVMSEPDRFEQMIASYVGHTDLKVIENNVRGTALKEALARSDGSKRSAAKLLGVSRQLMQHMVKKLR